MKIDKKLVELLNERSQCRWKSAAEAARHADLHSPRGERSSIQRRAQQPRSVTKNAAIPGFSSASLTKARSGRRVAMHGIRRMRRRKVDEIDFVAAAFRSGRCVPRKNIES